MKIENSIKSRISQKQEDRGRKIFSKGTYGSVSDGEINFSNKDIRSFSEIPADIGLTSRDIDTVQSIFQKYTGINRVRVFGSRAKGNYRKGSDIDLAIEGSYERFRLMDDFEESSLPYFVDIVDPAHCSSPDLIDHIARVGQVIYEK